MTNALDRAAERAAADFKPKPRKKPWKDHRIWLTGFFLVEAIVALIWGVIIEGDKDWVSTVSIGLISSILWFGLWMNDQVKRSRDAWAYHSIKLAYFNGRKDTLEEFVTERKNKEEASTSWSSE